MSDVAPSGGSPASGQPGLAESLAAALGVDPAGVPDFTPPPPKRTFESLQRFASLRLPPRDEECVGEVRAARRERERRDLTTPSALIRKAVEEWPQQADQVAAIAVALAVPKGEAWRRVIVAGIAALADEIGGPE